MTGKTKKIHIKIQQGKSGISSFGGLWSVVELFRKTGLPQLIDENIGVRRTRGAKDSEHILSLVLLQLAGGSAVDHLSFLKEKLSFEGLGVSIPSPTASRKWLGAFHNEREDEKRGMGKAFLEGRREKRDVALAGVSTEYFERRPADAALGRGDGTDEGRIVVLVRQ